MKKLLTLILCISMAFAMAVPAFAGCDDGPQAQTYISELFAVGYFGDNVYLSIKNAYGLPDSSYVVGGKLTPETDLNRGTGYGTGYIRLVKKTLTTDPTDAIRDLIAVYRPYEKGGSTSVTHNDCTYYAVGGLFKDESPTWLNMYSMNYYAGLDCTTDVYLYYTKDPKAGEPITDLKIYFDSENNNQPNLVREIYQNCVCDFNEGAPKARATYLQMIRSSSSTGSVFAGSTSVIAISAGVVIILAVVGFVVFKKRKGTAQ